MAKNEVGMTGVREYCEEMCVSLGVDDEGERQVIVALNEAGCNSTEVDLLDILEWIAGNMPGVYMQFVTTEMMRVHT